MDLSEQWHQFIAAKENISEVEEEQDFLRADVVRAVNKATAALELYHQHQRANGRVAPMFTPPIEDLMFWMQVVLSYSD